MAFIGIVHLAERLLNQSSTGGHDQPAAQKQVKRTSNTRPVAESEDQFTLSPQNETDPGLFRVTQYRVFSAAAGFLLAQSAPPNAEHTAAPPAATVLSEATTQHTSQSAAPAAPQAKAATV